jgi:hypothetical protein
VVLATIKRTATLTFKQIYSNYGLLSVLKCLLSGFGIFQIGATIALKVHCRRLCSLLNIEDVWVSILYELLFIQILRHSHYESLAYVN